jgi:hypothetical protein
LGAETEGGRWAPEWVRAGTEGALSWLGRGCAKDVAHGCGWFEPVIGRLIVVVENPSPLANGAEGVSSPEDPSALVGFWRVVEDGAGGASVGTVASKICVTCLSRVAKKAASLRIAGVGGRVPENAAARPECRASVEGTACVLVVLPHHVIASVVVKYPAAGVIAERAESSCGRRAAEGGSLGFECVVVRGVAEYAVARAGGATAAENSASAK